MKGRRTGIFTLKILVAALFFSCFAWQCANIGAPQGGPRDSIPPAVMSAEPKFNTVNFDGKRIMVTFNEYIQIKDQQKEFFSSPPMKHTPSFTIKGKSLQIDIKDTLQENTTYALNFGSAVRDNNEGNPLNGFRYVFSTGADIDSLYISGYTVDAYKTDSVSKTLIYFFPPDVDSIPDYDSTLLKLQPIAIGRAENNGIFIARNLKNMHYKVYAFQDENSNFTYDPGVDKVGFLEGTFNPLELPDFDVTFDTTRSYWTADPQIYFRMFTEKQFKRQNLAESKRPLQHKIELFFNAPFPQIDTLILEGIDSSKIITEYVTKGRDTINLWLNVPGEELPDTIKGRISYLRHDSINELSPYSSKLNFFWKHIESKEEQKEREKQEKERERAEKNNEEYEEPEKPNPFKVKINAGSSFNPEHNVVMDFDYPLISMDSTQISLIRIAEEDKKYRVKYELTRDTMNIRKWTLTAPWNTNQKYQLEIPAGVFLDVAGQVNDTIRQEFTTLDPEKFGTLTVNIKGKSDTSHYVLQLLDSNNRLLEEKPFARTGTYYFRYVNPGDVKLRVVEDMNGNGKWDSGDLIYRVQPERVEMYYPESGNELITMKVNWDVEISVDMSDLFKPIDIMDIRRQIEKSEQLRYQRWLEEKAKKEEERKRQRNQNQNQNSFDGFGTGTGSRQNIGSTGQR